MLPGGGTVCIVGDAMPRWCAVQWSHELGQTPVVGYRTGGTERRHGAVAEHNGIHQHGPNVDQMTLNPECVCTCASVCDDNK